LGRPRLAARGERVLLREVLVECSVRIGPGSEIVKLAPDLFGPAPCGVGEEWKVWTRLARLFSRDTMNSGHGDLLLNLGVTVFMANRYRGWPLCLIYRVSYEVSNRIRLKTACDTSHMIKGL